MTNEEAIKALKRIRKDWQFTYSYDCEAVEIAIRALKNEQTDRVITELEKITEIIKEIKGDNKYVVSDYMYGRYQAFDIVDDIIADRIAELKGESEEEPLRIKVENPEIKVDLISREEVNDIFREHIDGSKLWGILHKEINDLPAIPQTDYANYEAFGWCKGCKEYDTEKHCCHRYSSFIRETLQDSINAVLEDIKEEIEKLPRIKVGNSNSPTVKYCIDEILIYEVLEKHISGKEQ